jgi:hypothetical protein
MHERPGDRELLANAGLARFVVPDIGAYGVLEDMRREAEQRGYAAIR